MSDKEAHLAEMLRQQARDAETEEFQKLLASPGDKLLCCAACVQRWLSVGGSGPELFMPRRLPALAAHASTCSEENWGTHRFTTIEAAAAALNELQQAAFEDEYLCKWVFTAVGVSTCEDDLDLFCWCRLGIPAGAAAQHCASLLASQPDEEEKEAAPAAKRRKRGARGVGRKGPIGCI